MLFTKQRYAPLRQQYPEASEVQLQLVLALGRLQSMVLSGEGIALQLAKQLEPLLDQVMDSPVTGPDAAACADTLEGVWTVTRGPVESRQ